MATSLYDMSVASYLQTMTAVAGYLDKAFVFCRDKDIDTNEIVESRLFADMLPLRFQIVSVAHHSLGAIEGLKKGVFVPPNQTGPLNYPDLQKLIADTVGGLQRFSADEVNALEGREVVFQFRDRRSRLRPRPLSSRFHSQTSISMLPPPTTSSAPRACR